MTGLDYTRVQDALAELEGFDLKKAARALAPGFCTLFV